MTTNKILKYFQDVTMKDLESIPKREKDTGVYEQLIIIPTDKLHENGWGIIKLIGVDKDYNAEVITETTCDILMFAINHTSVQHIESFKIDLLPVAKVFKLFSSVYQFIVGTDGSTVDIKLTLKQSNNEK